CASSPCAVPGGRGGDHPSCHAAQVGRGALGTRIVDDQPILLPLFLFHSTGMAAWLAARYLVAGENNEATAPTAGWWLTRPLAVIGPLLFTLPGDLPFGKQWIRGGRGTRPATT
ncbi:MAG: hypothetical protein M3508_11110, partial [Actinomycetota bacterium]|nr:hypothetical protein [Actinomycetota bacterium]